MPFITPIELTPVDDHFVVSKTAVYYSPKYDMQYLIPSMTPTDLASVPWIAELFVEDFGLHTQAAVLHDYLYGSKLVPRAQADYLFYEAMLSCGVGKFKAKAMYYAVRAFGWRSY